MQQITIKFEKEDLKRVIMNLLDATAENDAFYELTKENIDNIYELLKSSDSSDDLEDFEKVKMNFQKKNLKKNK